MTDQPTAEVIEFCKQFEMTDEVLVDLQCRMMEAILRGLNKETHPKASIRCYPTYVQTLPTGKEKGKYYALDLGGTNFRVLLVTLDENYFDMKSQIYQLPHDVQTGTAEQLFDHIAACLIDFQKKHKIPSDSSYPLGFTFSFPCTQVGLDKAILVQWTKGFKVSGVVGNDVGQLLKDALKRKGNTSIRTCAILNDTTGTLMSLAWNDRDVRIGLIVGTGSNACYVEKTENVEVFTGDRSKPNLIINCESGNWGSQGEIDDIVTDIDRDIDEHSLNRSQQIFEKLVAGMYLGEIVRQSMIQLANKQVLFGGKVSSELQQRDKFESKYLSELESKKDDEYSTCMKIMKKFNMKPSKQDCVDLHYICHMVSRRSARLVSMGISVLIKKMGLKKLTVGIDGSVYRYHPLYHNIMMETIKILIDPSIEFQLKLSEDGSGRGAALVAAAACG